MAARRTTTKKTATTEAPEIQIATAEEPVIQEKKVEIRVKELSPTSYVTVRNGFNGLLVYKSKRTGERFIWDAFGDELDMELQELKNAKNANKAYFENGWFLLDDPEVIEWLGLERVYKNALTYDEFDDLFAMDAKSIAERIAVLSQGQKDTVKYRARQMIREGMIDSLKAIDALEKGLGVDLIEH